MQAFRETIRQERERGYSNIVPYRYSPSTEFSDTRPPFHWEARCMFLFYKSDMTPIQFTAFGGIDGANAVAEMELGKLTQPKEQNDRR